MVFVRLPNRARAVAGAPGPELCRCKTGILGQMQI
jgi:hypothetical protein